MDKPYLRCKKCGAIFHFPIKSGWFFGGVLSFLPIKIYFCAKCNKSRYLWLTDDEAEKYDRV
ncbi:hypothetical protein [Mucilaginibacter sp.]|uniref:hypothetical protein n=1 Tax=Mucilaginibacter sp. TaxID=1882438 RepID=UPI003D10FB0C